MDLNIVSRLLAVVVVAAVSNGCGVFFGDVPLSTVRPKLVNNSSTFLEVEYRDRSGDNKEHFRIVLSPNETFAHKESIYTYDKNPIAIIRMRGAEKAATVQVDFKFNQDAFEIRELNGTIILQMLPDK